MIQWLKTSLILSVVCALCYLILNACKPEKSSNQSNRVATIHGQCDMEKDHSCANAQVHIENKMNAFANFDLKAVLKILKESNSLEIFEEKINSNNPQVNNLYITNSKKIDYIKVREVKENEFLNIILYINTGVNKEAEVANIYVSRFIENFLEIIITANKNIFGNRAYSYKTFWKRDEILNLFEYFVSKHANYQSKFGFGEPSDFKNLLPLSQKQYLDQISSLKIDEKFEILDIGLNLEAILIAFIKSNTLQEFQNKLNQDQPRINNLDLNFDEYVDFLYLEKTSHESFLEIKIFTESIGTKNEIASISLTEDSSNIHIKIIGNKALFFEKNVYSVILDKKNNNFIHSLLLRANEVFQSQKKNVQNDFKVIENKIFIESLSNFKKKNSIPIVISGVFDLRNIFEVLEENTQDVRFFEEKINTSDPELFNFDLDENGFIDFINVKELPYQDDKIFKLSFYIKKVSEEVQIVEVFLSEEKVEVFGNPDFFFPENYFVKLKSNTSNIFFNNLKKKHEVYKGFSNVNKTYGVYPPYFKKKKILSSNDFVKASYIYAKSQENDYLNPSSSNYLYSKNEKIYFNSFTSNLKNSNDSVSDLKDNSCGEECNIGSEGEVLKEMKFQKRIATKISDCLTHDSSNNIYFTKCSNSKNQIFHATPKQNLDDIIEAKKNGKTTDDIKDSFRKDSIYRIPGTSKCISKGSEKNRKDSAVICNWCVRNDSWCEDYYDFDDSCDSSDCNDGDDRSDCFEGDKSKYWTVTLKECSINDEDQLFELLVYKDSKYIYFKNKENNLCLSSLWLGNMSNQENKIVLEKCDDDYDDSDIDDDSDIYFPQIFESK